jgi:hypothetical protein
MTVLEALLAVVIAFGVVASAIEASRIAANRSTIARLQAEAALEADALLSRLGQDLPLNPGHLEGDGGNGVRWAIDVASAGREADALQAFQVTSDVRISRAGMSVHQNVATLKIRWTKR